MGSAMVHGKLPVLGCPTNLDYSQHADTHFGLGVHVPPGTGIWGYKLKFEGTPFGSQ